MKPSPVTFILIATVAIGASMAAMSHYQQRKTLGLLEKRLEQIERQQHLLALHVLNGDVGSRDSLAKSLGYSRKVAGSPSQPTRTMREEEVEHQPAQEDAKAHAQLESVYMSEPINPQWAGATMQKVESAIVDVASEGEITPKAAQVDCRGQTCRIRLSLSDNDQIGQFIPSLLVKFAGDLPSTQSVEVPSADGTSIDVYIYATKG